ncbi:MAG: hypothetical protein HC866_14870 [Leptolyngbyaceae cyanobacterium RU_5_1]|nr:hypothetical protein [Leptolyngbyaceae cyanobacterium RU_5_1]
MLLPCYGSQRFQTQSIASIRSVSSTYTPGQREVPRVFVSPSPCLRVYLFPQLPDVLDRSLC